MGERKHFCKKDEPGGFFPASSYRMIFAKLLHPRLAQRLADRQPDSTWTFLTTAESFRAADLRRGWPRFPLATATVGILLLVFTLLPFGQYRLHAAPVGSVTPLHEFSAPNPTKPVQASDGNFYGTITGGTPKGFGSIYQVTPAGVQTTLYNFTGGTDGGNPFAGLVQGLDGNLYGTTRGAARAASAPSSGSPPAER